MGKGVSRAEVRQTADNVMRTQTPPLLPWVKVPWLNIFRTLLNSVVRVPGREPAKEKTVEINTTRRPPPFDHRVI